MSATGRTRQDGSEYERDVDDYYRTPGWVTRAVLPWLPAWRDDLFCVDAGAGDGAIADELPYPHDKVMCIERHPHKCEVLREKGYRVQRQSWEEFARGKLKVDVVVSNPPYSDAEDFVRRAIRITQNRGGGVSAFLLRLPWLASQSRASFHREHPAHVLVLPRRPSFTKNGKTDATDYAWFLWGFSQPSEGAKSRIVPGRWEVLDVEANVRRATR